MASAWAMAPQSADERTRVVVAFDGSPGSSNAVDWAALEASARGWPLCMIATSTSDSDEARHTVRRIADRLRENFGISVSVLNRAPGESLIEGVSATDLFVLGPSPIGCDQPLLQRSVGPAAAGRTPCPVVMVRGSFARRVQRILLGVDGSSAAAAAIEWACAEAQLHRAELLVVHATEPGSEEDTEQVIVEEAIEECRRRLGPAAVDLALQGSPHALLLALTRHRDLVVVGSRGRGGLKNAQFGSVAVGLADHAYCPVAITQPQPDRDGEESSDGSDTI